MICRPKLLVNKVNKVIKYIVLIIAAMSANAEQLKLNSIVDIDVYSSDIRAYTTGAQPLQCSSGELIEYLKGGDGTSFDGTTTTVPVNPNSPNDMSMPFDVEYKINDAAWCQASADPATSAWTGGLNIGNGNGIFTKNIYTGIPPGTSTFTLECSATGTNSYNLKRAVSKNDLELVQMYETMINLVLHNNEIFAWDILTGKIRTVEIKKKVELPNKFKLMLRQVGSEIYLIPTDSEVELPDGYVETNPKYSTMLTIGKATIAITINDINSHFEMPLAAQDKHCTNYSPTNDTWLNVTIGQGMDNCDLTGLKEVYLSAIVFER